MDKYIDLANGNIRPADRPFDYSEERGSCAVYEKRRGLADPLAHCKDPVDAQKIVDALNLRVMIEDALEQRLLVPGVRNARA